MEQFDLYDIDRRPLGRRMVRDEATPEGCYRLVTHVCIFNSEGKMLIQQRQPFKRIWSEMWDISCGGCVVSGEDSRTAAEREVSEELGIEIDLGGVRPTMTLDSEDWFDDVYIVHKDIDTDGLRLQPEEVQAARWATADEIIELIRAGEFVPYYESYIGLLFARKDKHVTFTKDYR